MARRLPRAALPLAAVLVLATAGLAAQQPLAKAAPVPFAGESVHPGTFRYEGKLETGQQASPVATEVRSVPSTFAGRPAWLFVQLVPGRMERVDSLLVDRATLVPLRYAGHFPNGPAIEATFRPDSVVGQITFGAERMPIRLQVPPPIYMVSAALYAAIATLPLAPGYTVSLRTIDLMEGQVTEHVFRVTGTEQVRVPAGDFEAWRVESGPLTLWVERAAPHRVLRETWPNLVSELKGGT